MKRLIGIILAIGLILVACPTNNGGNGESDGKQPGRFSATILSDSMKTSGARGVSLGTFDISNSKSIFFILRNVGDFPITNVTLTPGKLLTGSNFEPITDNGITASPGAITVLETNGNATVETVIEVDINHGNVIGLISQQYIQKADFAGATIRITGKTTNAENAVVDVSLDLNIETLIKVVSFEVHYSLDNGVTYVKAERGYPKRGDGSYDETNPRYIVPSAGINYVRIYNSGNVPLKYAVMGDSQTMNWVYQTEYKNVVVGSRSDLLSKTPYINERYCFVIDTIGVAFNNNGNTSLVFIPNSSIIYDNAIGRWAIQQIDIGLPNAD